MEGTFVFFFYFLICMIALPYSSKAVHSPRLKKRLVIALGIVLFLLGALRSGMTGVDTRTYMREFEYQTRTLGMLLQDQTFNGELGYYILQRLFFSLTTDDQLWLAFLVAVFVIPCAILIFKYSDSPAISYVYVVALFIMTFAWQGLRQMIAMAICLMSFILMWKKKWIPYLLLMLLAYQFHRSSIVFLLAVPLLYFRINLWSFVLIFFSWVIAVFSPATFTNFILEYLGFNEKFIAYASGNASQYSFTLFFLLLLLYTGCYLFKDELIKRNPINGMFLKMSVVGLMMQAMAVVIAEMFRASYYFSVFNMLLIANTGQLLYERYNGKLIRGIIILGLCVIFYWAGGFDYWFFWQ